MSIRTFGALWVLGSLGAALALRGATLAQGGLAMSLTLGSAAFDHEGAIPSRHTCDGQDLSPPLALSGIPEGTKSLALIVDDPDAPGRTFVHWVVVDLPPGTTALAEGAPLPEGARSGKNDFRKEGYGGPCPPSGVHRYFFKLYALDTTLPELKAPTREALEKAMAGHVLEEAVLMGRYRRHGR